MYKNLQFVGKVEPPDKEFLNCDILLTPNTIDLGIRVRILTAFGFRCPVVTHKSNKKGIPELKNKFNSLISDNSEGIAKDIVKLIKNKKFKNYIGRNGRKTFEKFFSHKIFSQNIKINI